MRKKAKRAVKPKPIKVLTARQADKAMHDLRRKMEEIEFSPGGQKLRLEGCRRKCCEAVSGLFEGDDRVALLGIADALKQRAEYAQAEANSRAKGTPWRRKYARSAVRFRAIEIAIRLECKGKA